MKWYQDSDGNASGKRIFGAIGFCLYLLIGAFSALYSIYMKSDIGGNAADILSGIGYVSGGLLGIGVVEKLKGGKSGDK